ncbi:mucin-5AC-like [Centropristis striata]|uniref:mucin-5AC-like n=1 Tax=Centropristis striata TaxID=184440 RepID=UPI0027E13CB5|nr:mucin-5AC-like [Centropristis striata]
MSGGVQQLFFLGLPDLNKLCSVSLSLQDEDEEPRSKQIKACRELVLLYSDLLASPALDSFTDITVVMAISFFQKGILQMFGQRRRLQLGGPQCVSPGVLQCCLSYSLITRLSPCWNKAGLFLIAGKDFLSENRRLNAVSMEMSTSEGQLCIGVETSSVRLPPTRLEDFDLPPLVLRRFLSDPQSVLDPSSTGGALWCHILPSMKKGQIITISRQMPRDGPFRTYRDLQNHWNRLYGYRLPELSEEQVVYCSVYFRLVGQRLFTYPLSCVRLQPVQRRPRVDLPAALGCFLSDVTDRLKSVCGFPARLTGKPRHHTANQSSDTVQVLRGEQVHLTSSSSSSSSSIRPGLPLLPPPRPVKPSSWPPLSQQEGGTLGNGSGFGSRLTKSQECRGDGPSSSFTSSSTSSSSPHVSFSFTISSGYLSDPPLSSSSSSSPPLYQPASPITTSSSTSSSCSLPLLQPASSLSSSSSSLQPASSVTSFSALPIFQPASSSSSTSSSSSSLPLYQPASSITSSSYSSSSLPLFQSASSITSSSSLPIFQPASSLTSSSSSSLPIFRPASSLSSSSSTSSFSSLPPPPPPVLPAPKLVPIFGNRCPSRQVNVALLRLQRQQREQLGGAGGGAERGRVTLPTFGRTTPASAPPSGSSLSAASLPAPPPRIIPRFNRGPRPPQPAGAPRVKHLPSLSPSSWSKPGLLLTTKPKPQSRTSPSSRSKPGLLLTTKPKPQSRTSPKPKPGSVSNTSSKTQPPAAPPEPPRPLTPTEGSSKKKTSSSSRGGVVFESKQNKSRSVIVDVEQMARSNQLSRLTSSSLLSWLRGRGVVVGAKHKKEELMLKVMGCLAEA